MIQVWLYDENKIFIKSKFVKEVVENMTDVPLLIGYIKPTFNEELQEWYEGATEEEIKAWEEEHKIPHQPTELEVLQGKVANIENINAGLLLENAQAKIDINKQKEINQSQDVVNANLLLEIATLKQERVI